MDLIDFIVIVDSFIILAIIICWPSTYGLGRRINDLEYENNKLKNKMDELYKKVDEIGKQTWGLEKFNDGHYY